MNQLVREIIKPILEADDKITKIIGIYGGRFQPFGPHHLKAYKWLTKQFDDVYITTSNKKQPPRHPMNFKEKVRHMTKMGIPANKIVQETSPYVAKNLATKFDPEGKRAFLKVSKSDKIIARECKFTFHDMSKNVFPLDQEPPYELLDQETDELLGIESYIFKNWKGNRTKTIWDKRSKEIPKFAIHLDLPKPL